MEKHKPFLHRVFPRPSGHYAVGSKVFHLIDSARKETYALDMKNRELTIKLYYPCEGPPQATKTAYSTTPYWQRYLESEIHAGLVTDEMVREFSDIFTYSTMEAEPICTSSFPLVLFSPGYDSGPYTYTAFCEGLASEEYVVCFINHTYAVSLVSFPDGRDIDLGAKPDSHVVEVCTADVPFVLKELFHINSTDNLLKEIIDLSSIAIVGHSLGGMVSINSIKRVPQIKAGISLDPPLDPSVLGLSIDQKCYDATQLIHKPFLYILEGRHKEIYKKSPLNFSLGKDNFKTIIDGSFHNDFSDYCLFKLLIPWLQRVKGDLDTGSINGFDLIGKTLEHMKQFLKRYIVN